MKKIIALVCSILISISILFCFIFHYEGISSQKSYHQGVVSKQNYYKGIISKQKYYEGIISKEYYDAYGENLSKNKFKSVALQKMGAERGDNLFMFGSSELVVNTNYFIHPINFFKNKRDGFQVNLIGQGGYKSLVHAADFGALGNSLKGQKVVFVVSPQWFTPEGIKENEFEANSSELQVYGFLFNKSISLATKEEFSKRIIAISSQNGNKQFAIMRQYCSLYSKNDIISKSKRYSMTLYYWLRYELLTLKDDIDADKDLKSNPKKVININSQSAKINWNAELKKAAKVAKSRSKNNKFGMDNKAYKLVIKGNFQKLKGSMKNDSYSVSPEYTDFKLLLEVCKEEGIKPLILNIPVNGMWDDYAGFNKKDRLNYYKKIDSIVNSYGFEVADFSKYENKKYFLMDDEHIGWEGWVYIDKAIDKYYNENKK